MTQLNSQARGLIEAARLDDEPSSDDQARIRSKLALRIAQGAVVGGGLAAAKAGTAATAAAATGTAATGAAAKVALLLVVGAVGAGAFFGLRAPQPPRVMSVSAVLLESASRIPVIKAAPALPGGDAEPALEPTVVVPQIVTAAPTYAHATKPKAAPEAAAPVSSADALKAETALIRRAHMAVREGRSDEALALLEDHSTKHPNGQLKQERQIAQILALCAAGKTAQAKALGATFLGENPGSPLAARIRSSCAGK